MGNDGWSTQPVGHLIEMSLYGDADTRRKARDELRKRVEREQDAARTS